MLPTTITTIIIIIIANTPRSPLYAFHCVLAVD
jgi:hypothetical protein